MTLDERRTSNLALVPTMARVECPECHGIGRLNWESAKNPDWKIHATCLGTGTLPNPLGVKYELAETVACLTRWWKWDAGMEGVHTWPASFGAPCEDLWEHPEKCRCKGTGRVLRPVDLEDEVSVAWHCGLLQGLLSPVFHATSLYDIPLDNDGDEWNTAVNLIYERIPFDLPAAEDAIGELMLAMQEVKDAS